MNRRDFLAASTGASFSLPVIKGAEDRPRTIHWLEKEDGEFCLCTPGGRILISVLEDIDEKNAKLERNVSLGTWMVLDQQQMTSDGNWVKLGRFASKARAIQVAEEMFK